MADLSIPLTGMSQAASRVNTAASRIARLASPARAPEDTVDLSSEMITLMESRNLLSANVKVAQTLDNLNATVLNILA